MLHIPTVSEKLPARKTIYHIPPFWVSDDAIFFLTINCQTRGRNQLAHPEIAEKLINTWLFYQQHKGCSLLSILVMPDHLHMLISFSWNGGEGMPALLKSWKRYTAKQTGIRWQRDFFDHRIRNKNDWDQKWDYIINNPVHANLVESPEQWPYRWTNPEVSQSEYFK